MRNANKILVGLPEGKNDLENLDVDRDNIKTDLKEIWWKSADWFQVSQDRRRWRALVNTVMNLRVQKKEVTS
jgi:hypothetical protein